MPHQCTNCGHVFADGSKEMLSGCPDCGGNKFQFHPGEVPDQPSDADPPERPTDSGVTGTVGKAAAKVRDLVGDDEPDSTSTSTASTDSPTARNSTTHSESTPSTQSDSTTSSQSDSTTSSQPDTAPSTTATPSDVEDGHDSEEVPDRDDEDLAQQSARSEMVSEDDLPPSDRAPTTEKPPDSERGRVVSEPTTDERPDMEALREELNSQFESIRIVSPGTYELNLMELYDREEYIIALQENGRYVIEVPDAWEVQNADDEQ